MSVEEAREKLSKLADPKKPPLQEGGDRAEGGRDKDDDHDDADRTSAKENAAGPADKRAARDDDADAAEKDADTPKDIPRKKPARTPDDEDNEGTRILWKLAPGTPYEWIFIIAGPTDKITAVFGYAWKDKPIPFDEIGDVSKAPIHSPEQVAWDSLKPPLHYRITASGQKEHATDVNISFVAVRSNGVHRAGHP